MPFRDQPHVADQIGDRRSDERRDGWRRWRYVKLAFLLLVIANTFALWWISDTRNERAEGDAAFAAKLAQFDQQLTRYVGGETLGACQDVNEVREGIRNFLARSRENVKRLADQGVIAEDRAVSQLQQIKDQMHVFRERSCDHAIRGLPDPPERKDQGS